MRPIDCTDASDWYALWIPDAAQGGAKPRGGALLLGVPAGLDHRPSSHKDVAHAVRVPGKKSDAEPLARREPLEIEVGAVEDHQVGAMPRRQDPGGGPRGSRAAFGRPAPPVRGH